MFICRLLPAFGFRTLAEFFFSLGREEDSALRFVLLEAVVAVWWLSSRRRLVTPNVPLCGLLGPVSIEAAFLSLSCSALLWPAEPLSLMRGPGVFANAFATFVFVGAKWFAPTTFTFPDSYFYRLFTISVLTLFTVL